MSRIFRREQFVWMDNISKLPVNGFEWVEELSQFKEDVMKNYDEDSK